MARSVLDRGDMAHESRLETEPVTGTVAPDQAASASLGTKLDGFTGPIEYLAYQREGIRHAWTPEPDSQGRYFALTLELQADAATWEITADQPFDSRNAAEAWAARLMRETDG